MVVAPDLLCSIGIRTSMQRSVKRSMQVWWPVARPPTDYLDSANAVIRVNIRA
jgi:hypothetical protein